VPVGFGDSLELLPEFSSDNLTVFVVGSVIGVEFVLGWGADTLLPEIGVTLFTTLVATFVSLDVGLGFNTLLPKAVVTLFAVVTLVAACVNLDVGFGISLAFC
jgi:hypothetical protein